MKAWIVLAVAGSAVLIGTALIVRDLSKAEVAPVHVSDWRPAKQLTVLTADGKPQTLRLQPDTSDARGASLGRLTAFEERWSDAKALAERTPRMQLAGPVKDLQSLAREARTLELSECLEIGRPFWTAGLDAEADVVLGFLSQDRRSQSAAETAAALNLGNWFKVVNACG